MGCVASKKDCPVTPPVESGNMSWELQDSNEMLGPPARWNRSRSESGESAKVSSGKMSTVSTSSFSARMGNFHKHMEGEQIAAGWPAWLTAVAGESIQGLVPLKADSFQKLEKIGQGTYSSVFRARDIENGKIVALKKVRFDHFEPESVKFMAREIQILRRLNHPNVVKLEGLITSRFSCSLYLVFEYMEHDLSGLTSCLDIQFSESQVKCYMHQLLSGLAHCHSRGIIHRDIKCANVLVNNEGIVKIADFGLANYVNPERKQPLTSRVVTLWYRPPELLLGSTDYETTVDLWSVGCVFAEMLVGKPILQGRTEVEQLHKIFKLCGSPSEEYWKKSKLPHATIFKPQHPYESGLQETYDFLLPSTLSLLETFLSIEPYKRGTAASALASEYFTTKPYACEPSTLPKYPPNKEIDAKGRESQRTTSTADSGNEVEIPQRPSRASRASIDFNGLSKLAVHPADSRIRNTGENGGPQGLHKTITSSNNRLMPDLQPARAINPHGEGRHFKHVSQGDMGRIHFPTSNGFEWAKRQNDGAYIRSRSRQSSKSNTSATHDPMNVLRARNTCNLEIFENGQIVRKGLADCRGHKPSGVAKHAKQWPQAESCDFSKITYPQDFAEANCNRDAISSNRSLLGYHDHEEKVEFSGPVLARSHKVDEFLKKHERHFRQAARRSFLQKGVK